MDLIAMVPPQLRPYAKDYFAYSVNALPLAGGAVATPNFAIQNDSDFMMVAMAGVATNPANPTVTFLNPALTVDIRSGGSGRLIYNQPQHWQNTVGTAQRPFLFYWPKFVKRASQIDVTLTNLSAAVGGQPYDVRLTFHGFKIFEFKEGI